MSQITTGTDQNEMPKNYIKTNETFGFPFFPFIFCNGGNTTLSMFISIIQDNK